ncbi:hypothetical protein A1O3_01122 [Capronia epimyces CBS 606.96]|uniref:Transmembrane protein n=1 Tax=Capronia epimyces CBS 606.96 TaxID=1182542 RepID=W9YSD3_9EURO|nr:uncharacterized protein A1O3_01122 [Capronia epimyces CBS 606.96]EXJ92570.1 hypothetical protein A1O3_01122 [Capronia epimyces CBS 606.96]
MYGGSVRNGYDINHDGHSVSIPMTQNLDYSASTSERSATPSGRSNSRSNSRSTHASRRHARRHVVLSRKTLRDPRVNAKAKLSFAFGVTLLIALVIYLALAVTGVARNTMFHVLSILLILTLFGIFCHQLIRMFMLMRRPRRSRHRTGYKSRHAHAHARGQTSTRTRRAAGPPAGPVEELPPEKPIQVFMEADDSLGADVDVEAVGSEPSIRLPPPVYGNFRTSRRMNPDFVHLKHVPPSPLTPTYEEAVSQVRRAMGYRPPSYISESGVTELMEARSRDVDAALDNIHPLERERMRTLAADALEGHHPTGI